MPFRYVEQVPVQCSDARRMGHVGDGGWSVCMAEPYTLKAPCLVYSLGWVDIGNIKTKSNMCEKNYMRPETKVVNKTGTVTILSRNLPCKHVRIGPMSVQCQ